MENPYFDQQMRCAAPIHWLINTTHRERVRERERDFIKIDFFVLHKGFKLNLIKMYIITSCFIFVAGFLIIVEGKPATKENGDKKDPKTKEGTEKAPGLKEHQKLS